MRRLLWLLPPVAVLVVFFGYPLALVLHQSFVGDDGFVGLANWEAVLASAEFRRALVRTALLAVAATAGCLVLGVFLALVIAFAPFPGVRAISRLVDVVLAFPSFLIALAFTFLYGSAGVLNAALASGACLTLLLCMNEFGIVLFVGAKDVITSPMLVYTKAIVTFDYPAACVVAVVNVVFSGALYALHRWVFAKGRAVLLWTRRSRAVAIALFAVLFTVVVVAPLAMIVLASVAGSWNGVLPSNLTGEHLASAVSGDAVASAVVSAQTAVIAALTAVVLGTWLALGPAKAPAGVRRVLDAAAHLPLAVPSVVVGLGLLVAFSRSPLLLNGTRWIVLVAHLVILLPFTFSVVSAAQRRVDPLPAAVAESLGASALHVLWRVRVPVLLPAMSASASLGLALSMGEVGATIMLYPPDWRTLPVSVFALTDRGQVFAASASTVLLLGTTLAGLVALGLVRPRAAER
ncbi:ABC-type Fe3+ transport system permease subunit [Saccharothrix tamanrassetensis]|uniref:ABC-type Fe3+ transport system permease subunit n=1 Tax=Saccharothrix tamanrassetensis TaxID=1051531 RepID=A0A841CRY3_9PSEU|nr:ABC transporter permease subunit [Saccharothrix tamanrassetensis]MBB5960010.1 ABC-type Fe3+ transport system permease subunit [Saccharothrix tamanrassetensis]